MRFWTEKNFIHRINSKNNAGYTSLAISTNTISSNNLSVASSTPDLSKHTHEDFIFEDKECSTSDDNSSEYRKKITIYTYFREMFFGRWCPLTKLASFLQAHCTFTIQSSYILII